MDHWHLRGMLHCPSQLLLTECTHRSTGQGSPPHKPSLPNGAASQMGGGKWPNTIMSCLSNKPAHFPSPCSTLLIANRIFGLYTHTTSWLLLHVWPTLSTQLRALKSPCVQIWTLESEIFILESWRYHVVLGSFTCQVEAI